MNLQSLVVVALRLIALNFLLEILGMSIATVILQLNAPSSSNSSLYSLLFYPGGLLVCPFLLWFLSQSIARLVTRRLPQDISFGAMPLADCYSIAFIGVGVYYIAGYLTRVLTLTCHLFKGAAASSGYWWLREVNGTAIAQAYIPFIAGILLFAFGRKWAVMLARKHAQTTVLSSLDSNQPQSQPVNDRK